MLCHRGRKFVCCFDVYQSHHYISMGIAICTCFHIGFNFQNVDYEDCFRCRNRIPLLIPIGGGGNAAGETNSWETCEFKCMTFSSSVTSTTVADFPHQKTKQCPLQDDITSQKVYKLYKGIIATSGYLRLFDSIIANLPKLISLIRNGQLIPFIFR